MAMADYHLCASCGGKAFYDADIVDPHYVASYNPEAVKDVYFRDKPVGIAALCWKCNMTHQVIVRKRG